MLQSFKLDPVDILERSRHWKGDLERLQQEFDSITEISAVDTAKVSVKSSNIADTNYEITARREDIRYRMDEIRGNIDDLGKARTRLSQEENDVLDLFFFTRGEKGRLIENYADSSYQSVRRVYRVRREALEHLREILTELYCGEWVQIK